MRLSTAIKALCLVASLSVTTAIKADKRHYPLPSTEPFEIGAEEYRDKYLTLRRLEGVYVNFDTIRSAGEELGISVPKTLYQQVQNKLEAAGLVYLSEAEMALTPGQPLMNLWPLYEGEAPAEETEQSQEGEAYGSCGIPVACSASLWASFEQSATLLRQPENQYKLATWGDGDDTNQCEDRGQWMADAVLTQIDNFIADFKKAQLDPAPIIVSKTADVPQQCSQSWVTHLNVFATNETKINQNIKPILDKLQDVAARCNTFSYIIETHADQRAAADYNRLLTEGRARSIKDYLISQGMDYHRIHMRPLGESAPIATGTTAEDHAKNRRVVIIPIKPEDIANAQLEDF
jgi:outer membrane protein OmpA-like peptidoglycan-associated protein